MVPLAKWTHRALRLAVDGKRKSQSKRRATKENQGSVRPVTAMRGQYVAKPNSQEVSLFPSSGRSASKSVHRPVSLLRASPPTDHRKICSLSTKSFAWLISRRSYRLFAGVFPLIVFASHQIGSQSLVTTFCEWSIWRFQVILEPIKILKKHKMKKINKKLAKN